MKISKKKKLSAYHTEPHRIPFLANNWEIDIIDKMIYYISPVDGTGCNALQLYISLSDLFCSTQLLIYERPMTRLTDFLFRLENGWTIDEFSATKIHEGTIVDDHNKCRVCGGVKVTPVPKDNDYIDIWE